MVLVSSRVGNVECAAKKMLLIFLLTRMVLGQPCDNAKTHPPDGVEKHILELGPSSRGAVLPWVGHGGGEGRPVEAGAHAGHVLQVGHLQDRGIQG